MKKTLTIACISLLLVWACSKKDSGSPASSATTSGTTTATTSTTSTTSTSSTTSTTTSSWTGCLPTLAVDPNDSTWYKYDSKGVLTDVITKPITGSASAVDYNVTYNSSGQAIKISSTAATFNQTFEYLGTQLNKFKDNDGSVLQQYSVFHYDATGKVDQLTAYDASDKMTGYDVFTYDANGNVIRDYTYNAIYKMVDSTTYEYDSKKNAFSSVNPNYIILRNDFDNWGANNATKSTYCSIGNQTVVTTTTYTYNANGYPVSATQSNTNNSGTFTTSYSYTCH